MTKKATALSAILKNIIYMGFGIQMVLGIIWMCCNITKNQAFTGQGGQLYLLLKPVLLCCPFVVYVLQLLLAFYAAERLAGQLSSGKTQRRRYKIFAAMAMVTFPLALQCHLAIAPFSIVSSLFLLEVGEIFALLQENYSLKKMARAAVYWVLMSLLLPVYTFPGLAALLMGVLFAGKNIRREKKSGKTLIILAASIGLALAVGALVGETKLLPDKEQVTYSLCSRMTWPTLAPDSERWPEELKKATKNYYWETSLFADNMEQVFRKEMLDTFGKEKAAEYYSFMAKDSWERHGKYILRQIIGDGAAYVVSPVILPIQLKGKAYVSYSGRNVEMFLMQAPFLSKFFLDYSCVWFVVSLAAAFVGFILLLLRKQVVWSKFLKTVAVLIVSAGLLALVYTFRGAGIMDYKCTIAINLLWVLGAMAATVGREEEA